MDGSRSRRPAGYQPFFPRPRQGVPHEAVHVEARLLREDLLQGGPRRGVRGTEKVADLRTLRDRERPDLAGDPDGLLLVEPDQWTEDDHRGGRVDRPQVLEGLAGALAEALPREEVRASLPPRDRLRDPDHQPLREDEVQPEVAHLRDLRERAAHDDDDELRDPEPLREPPGLHGRGVVRDRLQREVDREDLEPLAGDQVTRDGAVDPAAEQEERLPRHRHIPTYFAYRERARSGSSVPRIRARPSEKSVNRAPSASNTRTLPTDFTLPSFRNRDSTPARSIAPRWAGSIEIVSLPHSAAITWPLRAPRNSTSPFTHAGQSSRRDTPSRWSSLVHPSNTRSSLGGGRPSMS